MKMPPKQCGRRWEDDFFDIDFPDPPQEIVEPRIPRPKFKNLKFANWTDSIAIAFQNAANLCTRAGEKWNRRNPPEPYASRMLRIFKDSKAPFSKSQRLQLMLIPTVGTSADYFHGIDGVICLSNGWPLVTFDLSLDLSIKKSSRRRGLKADTIITPAHFEDDSLFNDLRDEMLKMVLRKLAQ
jgi:hypothetical protein